MSTEALYLHDSTLHTNKTSIKSVLPRETLSATILSLFKLSPPPSQETSESAVEPSPSKHDAVVTTSSTIFHPQGGGQPSDTGHISVYGDSSSTFEVTAVRKAIEAPYAGEILHYGVFSQPASKGFAPSIQVEQKIDTEKRILHSRIHDGGHILSLAVRSLIPEILAETAAPEGSLTDAKGKAQHYPGAAYVEFHGIIPGNWKDRIQEATSALVSRNLPIKVAWCTSMEQVEKEGIITTPEAAEEMLKKGEGMRVVWVEGIGAYPCGGTHVSRTGEVGEIKVRKISRQKGISKVSYEVV